MTLAIRIGHGFDVHRFSDAQTSGEALIIGGVSISYPRVLEAHSDGDVLIHAICDALLGAIAAGDIGHHFPDTDPDIAGIDSRVLLRDVAKLLRSRGWKLSNLDSTIVAQSPKMAPHIIAMRENLAADLNVAVECVSVKATTTEKLGFAGRGEGVAAHAVVLLEAIQ